MSLLNIINLQIDIGMLKARETKNHSEKTSMARKPS
jgi:hypothetical protein